VYIITTKEASNMTKQELTDYLKRKGWQQDKYKHFHQTYNGKELRFYMGKTSTRYEVKIRLERGRSKWQPVRSGYYKDLSFNNDKIHGLRKWGS